MYTESKRNKLEAKYKVNTAHSLRAISTALFKFFPVFFFIQQHSLVSTWSHFLCVYLFHCACLCFNYFISFPRTTCTVFFTITHFFPLEDSEWVKKQHLKMQLREIGDDLDEWAKGYRWVHRSEIEYPVAVLSLQMIYVPTKWFQIEYTKIVLNLGIENCNH